MSKAAEVAEKAQREYLAERLALCTDEEQAGFRRIFDSPSNPARPDVATGALPSAIDLVERTLANHEGGDIESI